MNLTWLIFKSKITHRQSWVFPLYHSLKIFHISKSNFLFLLFLLWLSCFIFSLFLLIKLKLILLISEILVFIIKFICKKLIWFIVTMRKSRCTARSCFRNLFRIHTAFYLQTLNIKTLIFFICWRLNLCMITTIIIEYLIFFILLI